MAQRVLSKSLGEEDTRRGGALSLNRVLNSTLYTTCWTVSSWITKQGRDEAVNDIHE